jgi:hypothetical protein
MKGIHGLLGQNKAWQRRLGEFEVVVGTRFLSPNILTRI